MPYRLLLALMFLAGLPSTVLATPRVPAPAVMAHATLSRAAFRPRVELVRVGRHRYVIDHAPTGWERHALPKGVKLTVARTAPRPVQLASRG